MPSDLLEPQFTSGRDQISTTGRLIFKNGKAMSTWGTGVFGAQVSKLGNDDIPIQLCICNPTEESEAVPYVSFIAKVPRDNTKVLKAGPSNSHLIEVRFGSGVGQIGYKVLTDLSDRELQMLQLNDPEIILPKKVICIQFKAPRTGESPQYFGDNWPVVPATEEGKYILQGAKLLSESEEYKLYLPYSKDIEAKLLGAGQMFAEKGFGRNLNQYLLNGQVM
jgi:hypothetical protein